MYKKLIKLLYIIFLLYIKMSTGYYQKNKKRAAERYQNLYEEKATILSLIL